MAKGFDAIKALSSIVSGIDNAQDKVTLYQTIDRIHELQSENRGLMEKVTALTEQLRRKKALEYRDGGYFVQLENGKLDGPICPECYDRKGLIYRLQATTHENLRCVTCGTDYPMPDGIEPPDPVAFV